MEGEYLPDDDLLFEINQNLASPESRNFTKAFVEAYGRGPFLRRTVPPNQVVLLELSTRRPVYHSSSGSVVINADFIKPWSGSDLLKSGIREPLMRAGS
jgi:hypothetical protein